MPKLIKHSEVGDLVKYFPLCRYKSSSRFTEGKRACFEETSRHWNTNGLRIAAFGCFRRRFAQHRNFAVPFKGFHYLLIYWFLLISLYIVTNCNPTQICVFDIGCILTTTRTIELLRNNRPSWVVQEKVLQYKIIKIHVVFCLRIHHYIGSKLAIDEKISALRFILLHPSYFCQVVYSIIFYYIVDISAICSENELKMNFIASLHWFNSIFLYS